MLEKYDLNYFEEKTEMLADETTELLVKGIPMFDSIISVLDITGRLLPNDSKEQLFSLYKLNIQLYKYANELLQDNRKSKYFYHQGIVRFRKEVLSCLQTLRKVIEFIKISGNILSENYVVEIAQCKNQWQNILDFDFFETYDKEQNNIEEVEQSTDDDDDWSYTKYYGEIEFEDEFTQPIV